MWSELNIAPTSDVKVIKRAYAARLKESNLESDIEGFQRLRQAYEYALNVAKSGLIEAAEAAEQSLADSQEPTPISPPSKQLAVPDLGSSSGETIHFDLGPSAEVKSASQEASEKLSQALGPWTKPSSWLEWERAVLALSIEEKSRHEWELLERLFETDGKELIFVVQKLPKPAYYIIDRLFSWSKDNLRLSEFLSYEANRVFLQIFSNLWQPTPHAITSAVACYLSSPARIHSAEWEAVLDLIKKLEPHQRSNASTGLLRLCSEFCLSHQVSSLRDFPMPGDVLSQFDTLFRWTRGPKARLPLTWRVRHREAASLLQPILEEAKKSQKHESDFAFRKESFFGRPKAIRAFFSMAELRRRGFARWVAHLVLGSVKTLLLVGFLTFSIIGLLFVGADVLLTIIAAIFF